MDSRQFRTAMGNFTTGVTVIVTELDGQEYGMTANAFMSLSLDPMKVIISVGENAKILSKIKESGKFSVNILSADQQELSMIFAGQIKEPRKVDFDYLDGKPVIPNALAQVTCDVSSEYVEGDHTLFVGDVTDLCLEEGDPLVFYGGRYCSLAKEEQVVYK
ncbi:flavin reductase family protein [Pseudalkalibacillus sp. A8]|uniref:flavin reductase family protein n=1 Tax=Pseudalkalibacillus sp. A8 TaxID=3382641 RepID=UPI0038B4B748